MERYVRDLAAAQVRRGHSVRLLTIDHDVIGAARGRLPLTDDVDGVAVIRVRAVGGQRKQFLAERPGRVIREIRQADVVHHHDPRFAFETVIASCLLLKKPFVFHTHGLILHTDAFEHLKRVMLRAYYGPVLRLAATSVVADSAGDAALLDAYCGLRHPLVRLHLNAIDLSRYRSIHRHAEQGRLLVFGRIDEHKGLERLFDALAAVDEPWHLDIVGAGPEMLTAKLRQRTVDLGIADRITWRGRLSDEALDDLLARAWLALFPSRFEGFGLALVEALAAGCPVLASDLPTHREIVEPQLLDRLVDFSSAAASTAIASELRRTVEELETASTAARAQAERFSVDRLVSEIDGLYEELRIAHRRLL